MFGRPIGKCKHLARYARPASLSARRVIYCDNEWLQTESSILRWTLGIETKPKFLLECFNDKATFHGNGNLNKYNSHYWSPVNPHWFREVLNQHRIETFTFGLEYVIIKLLHFFKRIINGLIYLDFFQNHLPICLRWKLKWDTL